MWQCECWRNILVWHSIAVFIPWCVFVEPIVRWKKRVFLHRKNSLFVRRSSDNLLWSLTEKSPKPGMAKTRFFQFHRYEHKSDWCGRLRDKNDIMVLYSPQRQHSNHVLSSLFASKSICLKASQTSIWSLETDEQMQFLHNWKTNSETKLSRSCIFSNTSGMNVDFDNSETDAEITRSTEIQFVDGKPYACCTSHIVSIDMNSQRGRSMLGIACTGFFRNSQTAILALRAMTVVQIF